VSSIGQQRKRTGGESTQRFHCGEACGQRQRDSECASAGGSVIVGATIVTRMVMARTSVIGGVMARVIRTKAVIAVIDGLVIFPAAGAGRYFTLVTFVTILLRRSHRSQCNHSGSAPKAGAANPYICLKRCA
jgi:hypothetical protein